VITTILSLLFLSCGLGFLVFVLDRRKKSINKAKKQRQTLENFIRLIEEAGPEEFESVKTLADEYLPTLSEFELVHVGNRINQMVLVDGPDFRFSFLRHISNRALKERMRSC
jgi:hypothetical protein